MTRTALLWSPAIIVGAAFALIDPPRGDWRTWVALVACMVAVRLARDTGQVR